VDDALGRERGVDPLNELARRAATSDPAPLDAALGIRDALLEHEPTPDYGYELMGCTCGWKDPDVVGLRQVDPRSKTWTEHMLRIFDAALRVATIDVARDTTGREPSAT
jgi:hypothetical protein